MKSYLYFAIHTLFFLLLSCGTDHTSPEHELTPTHTPETLTRAFIATYPHAEPQDLYKAIFHGTEGPRHFSDDMARVRSGLAYEWQAITPADEELWFPVGINNEWGWLNLKAWKYRGGSLDTVTEAFIRSISASARKPEAVSQNWMRVTAYIAEKNVGVMPEEYAVFTASVIENNFPVHHHTPIFIRYYSPAYRVILRSIWEEVLSEKSKGDINVTP